MTRALYLIAEVVALGAPLVIDQAERERLYKFAAREHQSGGAVWVRWFWLRRQKINYHLKRFQVRKAG